MKPSLALIRRLSAVNTQITPQICVVGSGPAGFYAAQHIANRLKTAQIDIIERLPVPFGLVRFGVAPDHFNLKKCINTFTKTAQLNNVRFLGNINLGTDVSLKQLKDAYHVVLLAYGVDDCKKFGIPGDQLKNIHQAKNFVGWYNGVPWDKDLDVDLSGEKVAIFGHGNVAIDVARILLSPIDHLKTTDITEHALAALSSSKVREVSLIGRRGPLQVSFTTKELRELLNLESCCTIWRPDDLNGVPEIIPQLVVPRKRLTELIVTKFQEQQSLNNKLKRLRMIFLRSPKEFLGEHSVSGIKLNINKLVGDDLLNKKAVVTQGEEIIDSNLVVNSIGYKSIQADPDIPFNFDNGVVTNKFGKVEDGLYAAGWVASGPTGVLLHTMDNAFRVASLILKDLEVSGVEESRPGFEEIGKVLNKKNVQVVTWNDWLKIDEYETNEGKKVNKSREKLVDIRKMLEIASN